MKRWLLIFAIPVVIVTAFLCTKQQTIRTDHFVPNEGSPQAAAKARVTISPPFPNGILSRSMSLWWYQPENIGPLIWVRPCDPSYTAVTFRRFQVTVDVTNVIVVTSPADGERLEFKPPMTGEEPQVFYTLVDSSDPLLNRPPGLGTKVKYDVALDILAGDTVVCSTNLQAEFAVERIETHASWAAVLFWRTVMPRF